MSRSRSPPIGSVCCILAVALVYSAVAEIVDVGLMQPAAEAEATASFAAQQQTADISSSNSRLPTSRPAAPTGGWDMCNYKCMSNNLADAVKTGNQTKGVLEIDIVHKPIAGVTTNMIKWLRENINGSGTWFVDGKVYPLSLLLHPVDHCQYTLSKTSGGSSMLEYPLTGCSYNATQSSSPWTCPKQRTGLVATTKLKQLRAPHLDVREQNQTRVVRYLNQGGYRVVIEAKAGIFKRTVFSSTYSWKDTPDGLQVTTRIMSGLMKAGSDTQFDRIGGRVINPLILKAIPPSASSDLVRFGQAYILHILQEYEFTKNWLPGVYNNRAV